MKHDYPVYLKWLGKPHKTGADPDNSDSCDCLLMTVRVRESLGLPVPHKKQLLRFFRYAKQNDRTALRKLFHQNSYKLPYPKEGAFTLTEDNNKLGCAVFITNGLLYVHHVKGVTWVPETILKDLDWFDWRSA